MENIPMHLAKAAPALLEACKAQHEAIDRLFALLISKNDGFYPTRSGQPWKAMEQGVAAIAKAEGANLCSCCGHPARETIN